MNEQSIASISFIISAAYTFTFANAIYFAITGDTTSAFNPDNIIFKVDYILCGIICMIMSLRFFFGNNNYIYQILKSDKNHWIKFYQFTFIGIQSVILLISSYFIQDSMSFVRTILLLFCVEVFWYFLTMIVDPSGVLPDDKKERIEFFIAELVNLIFVILTLILIWNKGVLLIQNLVWIFIFFILNTIYDAYKNMASYMGNEDLDNL